MKKIFLAILMFVFTFLGVVNVSFSNPTNSISIPNSFSPNTTISSSSVNSNFNEISTKFDAHSHNDITQLGAITTGTWTGTVIDKAYGGTGNANGIGLPSGAVFFMISGSCPTGTTDVTATYNNKYLKVNASQGTNAATGHTHAAGTYIGPSHTHTIPNQAIDTDGGTSSPAQNNVAAHNHGGATGSDGTGSVTGSSASDDTAEPSNFEVRMCQVD